MTRGKHSALAASRREQSDHEAEVATYQAALVKKQAEITRLDEALSEAKRVHADRVRELTARLEAGVSTELEAARSEILELREESARLRADRERFQKMWDTAWKRLGEYAQSQLGLKGLAVSEWIGALTGEAFMIVERYDKKAAAGDPKRLVALQRARGQR